MRDREKDEQFMRKALQEAGIQELVYISPNTYDGGYELRVGVTDLFVDYATIDDADTTWVQRYGKK